jgi:TolB-like protein
VNVLDKPRYFDTQKNGVVRIHASRLRQALINYYRTSCSEEDVIISIPKGRYVPIFQPFKFMVPGTITNVRYLQAHKPSNKSSLAILPFISSEKTNSRIAFTDSIGKRLSIELNNATNFSIISYNMVKELDQEHLKIQSLYTNLNVKYILSGDVHFEGKNIRVFVQLTDASTQHQVWSDFYDFLHNIPGYFELSDFISNRIMGSLRIFVSGMHPSFLGRLNSNPLTIQNKKLLKSDYR